jgi:hypothetical protein
LAGLVLEALTILIFLNAIDSKLVRSTKLTKVIERTSLLMVRDQLTKVIERTSLGSAYTIVFTVEKNSPLSLKQKEIICFETTNFNILKPFFHNCRIKNLVGLGEEVLQHSA